MAVNTNTLAGILAASRGATSVPPYLNPNVRISPNTAGEDNRFRNIARTATPTPTRITGSGTSTRSAEELNQMSREYGLARSGQLTGTPSGRGATVTTTPVQVQPPVSTPAVAEQQPEFSLGPINFVVDPEPMPTPEPEPTPYSVYDDPFYQQALAQAQSQFNLDRINALASQQYQEKPLQRELEMRPDISEQSRRRLAGNFAARGMAGGRAGALTRAEAQANAREIAARTGLREQIAELGRQFTSQYGAEGTDWLGTRRGMEAQQAAIQLALQNRLGGLTTVG